MWDNNSEYNITNDGNITGFSGPAFIHPFSYLHVKVIFIILYSLVFAGCFLGNIGIIFLIIKNKALRTRTNFFLANLAVADFCVGNLCVLPNLSIFLSPIWVLGKAMCKLYYFVQGMSYTASILLLTVIAIERYIAIMHPLRSRHLFTFVRLQVAQVCIWLLAFCCNIPILLIFDTMDIVTSTGDEVSYCFVLHLSFKDMRTLSTVNFVLWYIFPLIIMIIIYTRISITLWKTSGSASEIRPAFVLYHKSKDNKVNNVSKLICVRHQDPDCGDGDESYKHNIKFDISKADTSSSGSHVETIPRIALREKFSLETITSNLKYDLSGDLSEDTFSRRRSSNKLELNELRCLRQHSVYDLGSDALTSASVESLSTTCNNRLTVPRVRQVRVTSGTGLTARRKVIRLLMILLITFALCVLPNHLRVLLHYWNIYPPHSGDIGLLSPISFLLLYLNSALNPALYWVFSESFRRSLRDTFKCHQKRKR